MKLKQIDFKEFEEDVYPKYILIFKEQIKTISEIEKNFAQNVMKIFKIIENEQFVGFMIINKLQNSNYIQLDYFAILPEYQSKGYGSKAILELNKLFKNEENDKIIFIEVEKEGHGKTEEENTIRKKRVDFYERLGFEKTRYEIELLGKLYSTYILSNSNKQINDEEMINDILSIYKISFGEEKLDKCIKIIEN